MATTLAADSLGVGQPAISSICVVADARAEEGGAEAADRAAHQHRHVFLGFRHVDGGDAGEERDGVGLLDRGFVHERAVERRDLGLVSAGGGIAGRVAFNQLAQAGFGQIAKRRKGAVGGAVGGNLGGPGPVAVHIAEEIVAGLHRAVHAGKVDAPRAHPHRVGGGGGAGAAGLIARGVEDRHHRAGVVDAVVVMAGAGGGRRGGGEGKERGGGKSEALLHQAGSPIFFYIQPLRAGGRLLHFGYKLPAQNAIRAATAQEGASRGG
jgi:hypothetical protein